MNVFIQLTLIVGTALLLSCLVALAVAQILRVGAAKGKGE